MAELTVCGQRRSEEKCTIIITPHCNPSTTNVYYEEADALFAFLREHLAPRTFEALLGKGQPSQHKHDSTPGL
jgi:hypothetical protein